MGADNMESETRTQDHRHMSLDTTLGKDKVLVLKMTGTETLGRLFQYELDVFSEGGEAIQAKDLLGTNATVRLNLTADESYRYLNGFISKFKFVSVNKNKAKVLYTYKLTLTPALWRLTRSATCRIFQQKTVMDIVNSILQDAGIESSAENVSGSYRTWDYCVQYRETDFNFVQRLLENEGIYYYFEHTDGHHKVMFCDSPTAHSKVTDSESLKFEEPDVGNDDDLYVWNWEHESEQVSDAYELMDYDHLNPGTDLFDSEKAQNTESTSIMGLYDYPGGYDKPADAKTYARKRMEEVEAQYQVAEAETSAKALFCGATFALQDHPAVPCVDYLVTSMTSTLVNDDYGTNLGDSADDAGYFAEITVMPAKVQYRSPRLTPKPVIQGPQTAVVVGASGEEIHTNTWGMAKVHFFWDRSGVSDDTASCWIRVSQNWAGKQWGAVFLPRVGQEVIVEFLEGDPDRPIITGRVYNGDNVPPYDLPTMGTISAIKSNSSTGGQGFNEFRFEDKKGEEQLFMHAEKNMDVRVKNDRFQTIGNNKHLVVGVDYFEHIKNNLNVTVDTNHNEKIGADHNWTIGGKQAVDITGTQSLKVGGDVAEQFGSNHSETTTGDYYLKADNIVIEGKTKITIKVGGVGIAIAADGVKVIGPAIEIVGGNTIDIKGGSTTTIQDEASLNLKAPVIKSTASTQGTFDGGGTAIIKGGVVNIN